MATRYTSTASPMSPQHARSLDVRVAAVRRKRPYVWWIGAIALLGAAAAIFVWQSRIPHFQAVTTHPLTSEGAPDWLADAVTEEIVDALGPITKSSAEPALTAVVDGTV